jgi:hypothetical protein
VTALSEAVRWVAPSECPKAIVYKDNSKMEYCQDNLVEKGRKK